VKDRRKAKHILENMPPSNQLKSHFIFLIHGFMGCADELSFLEEALNEAVAEEKEERGDLEQVPIIIHGVKCNNTSTFDGIAAGGGRLADEVQGFVSAYVEERRGEVNDALAETEYNASISFFGYSLGGMYSRYALSVLPFEFSAGSTNVKLHPMDFCTAATPHLGIAAHTYFILPRCMEYMFAYLFGKTGKDLFRLERQKGKKWGSCLGKKSDGASDLIFAMATQDKYLRPLAKFRRRISFINAFGTDLQVPTATAGMISKFSDSPHRLVEDEMSDRLNVGDIEALVFDTEPCDPPNNLQSGSMSGKNDETLTMTKSLDSLGWTKVFVDCRKGMKGSVRCICRRPRREMVSSYVSKSRRNATSDAIFLSSDLCKLLESSEHLHCLPTGHFVLVAWSKTQAGAQMSEPGRPFVREAARELICDAIEFSYC